MSVFYISLAFKCKLGNPLTKLVLIKLADNANDDGECWPSLNKIVEQTEIAKRTVIEHLKTLEQHKLITIIKTKKDARTNLVNHYRLHEQAIREFKGVPKTQHKRKPIKIKGSATDALGSATDALPLPSATDALGSATDALGSATDAPGVVHDMHPNRHGEPSVIPSIKPSVVVDDVTTQGQPQEATTTIQKSFEENLSSWFAGNATRLSSSMVRLELAKYAREKSERTAWFLLTEAEIASAISSAKADTSGYSFSTKVKTQLDRLAKLGELQPKDFPRAKAKLTGEAAEAAWAAWLKLRRKQPYELFSSSRWNEIRDDEIPKELREFAIGECRKFYVKRQADTGPPGDVLANEQDLVTLITGYSEEEA